MALIFAFEGLKSRINHKIDIKLTFPFDGCFLFAHQHVKIWVAYESFFPRLKMKQKRN